MCEPTIDPLLQHKKDIAARIGQVAALGQLAEECGELAKAALKYQRILIGSNPTPVTPEEAIADITEEATDVQDCLDIITLGFGILTFDYIQSMAKIDRWQKRLDELDSKRKG